MGLAQSQLLPHSIKRVGDLEFEQEGAAEPYIPQNLTAKPDNPSYR